MPQQLQFENEEWRAARIGEILADENENRKKEHLKRFEVMQDRQHGFVKDKLITEFGEKALSEMRLVTSVNVTKRFVNSQASIYNEEPERIFTDVNEAEESLISDIYEAAEIDKRLKKANKVFKLHDQGAIQVFPNKRKNIIDLRVLRPHQYDVIPWPDEPEIAAAYVISAFDKEKLIRYVDGLDQEIADKEDYKKSLMKFIWWTDDFNFMTDGHGKVIVTEDPETGEAQGVNPNPIGRLPFVDLSFEKEFEFWIRQGKNVVQFSIDMAACWSDVMTISKMQGYAQAVITGDVDDLPDNVKTGPLHLLILPKSATSDESPTFQYVSPNPDLKGSLDALQMLLNNFLTAEGEDVDLVSSSPTGGQRFSSALERMLAQIDKFKATKDDFDLFRSAEVQVFDLIREWNNAIQDKDFLKPEMKRGKLNEKIVLDVNFKKPETIQTKQEREDGIYKKFEKGFTTKVRALAELENIDEKEAEKRLEEIQAEKEANAGRFRDMMNQNQGGAEGGGEEQSRTEVQPEGNIRDDSTDGSGGPPNGPGNSPTDSE